MSKLLHQTKYHRSKKSIMVLLILFISVLTAGFIYHKLSINILLLYAFSSTITFLLYRKDKQAAKNNTWRIKESTLLWLGLIGGWPGALAAQRKYRHKTSKVKFQLMFWLAVVINCLILGWWISR